MGIHELVFFFFYEFPKLYKISIFSKTGGDSHICVFVVVAIAAVAVVVVVVVVDLVLGSPESLNTFLKSNELERLAYQVTFCVRGWSGGVTQPS